MILKKAAKKSPATDTGMQSQSYCLSRLAQEQHLVELSHNRQRGMMRRIPSCPVQKTSTLKLCPIQNNNHHYCDNTRRKTTIVKKQAHVKSESMTYTYSMVINYNDFILIVGPLKEQVEESKLM